MRLLGLDAPSSLAGVVYSWRVLACISHNWLRLPADSKKVQRVASTLWTRPLSRSLTRFKSLIIFSEPPSNSKFLFRASFHLHMTICSFSGNADMYGLGIRLGFYLQWFGTILGTWVARKEVPSMRLSLSFFVAAIFLALIIQTHHENLRPVEIYIVLLLTFGGYLHLVPLYIWRLLIGCDPDLDPTRHVRVRSGKMFSRLNFFLLIAVCIFQMWFWIGRVQKGTQDGCTEFGFLFAKVRLNQRGFVVVNVVLYFLLLLFCVTTHGISLGKRWGLLEHKEGRGIG